MKTSQVVINDIKEKIKLKEIQKKQTLESLAILDAQIDKIDELIIKIDSNALVYINEITNSVNDLYSSYNQRISSGCRSDLYWECVDCWEVCTTQGGQDECVTYCRYEVKRDPSLLNDIKYTGIKYYQKRSNRDYDTDIVDAFIGDIDDGSTVIVVKDPNGLPPEINIGDTIVDNIDNTTTLFNIGNLPKVVGFGTTSAIVGVSSNIIGGIGTGSTIFAHYGSGDSSGFQVGYRIERAGIVTASIVGFGTTNFPVEYYDEIQEEFVTGIVTARSFILDSPAIASAAEKIFSVGVVSSFPGVFLSTEAISFGSTVTFTAIRYSNENIYEEFDYTKNPNSPLKIGIIDSSNLGIGHSVYFDESGDPVGPDTWKPEKSYIDPITNEVKKPEPEIGAGKVIYSIGDFTWPVFVQSNPLGGPVYTYAPLGSAIVIPNASGLSFTEYGISPNPPGPAVCNQIDNDIETKTQTRISIRERNHPIIKELIEKTRALRNQRAEKELYAWSLVQSTASLAQDIKSLKKDLKALENADYSKYES